MIFARSFPRIRAIRTPALVAMAALGSACSKEKLKSALSATPPASIDYTWSKDSTLMAGQPDVLFRVVENKTGPRIVPIASIGTKGFEMMVMGNRGWHFFDLTYLHAGSSVKAIRGGRTVQDVPLIRGQWESGKPALDSLAGCESFVPGGLVQAPSGVRLFTTAAHNGVPRAQALSGGELSQALDRAYKLVVPSAGVPMSLLSRYTKEVYQVETGVGPKPSLVVILDDPEIVADDVTPEGQRPRHVVLVLDNARFGYKVSFQYKTLGSNKTEPRYEWLDALDVDNDNQAELLFGLRNELYKRSAPTYTIGLRFKNDVWTQSFAMNSTRCQL